MTVPVELALPLQGPGDLDPLLDRVGDARYVLIGEATHGTHEFYAWRAALTQRLIAEKGFSFVAVEGDWPDCHKVNRSVTGEPGSQEDPGAVLQEFDRWPAWMWANEEVAAFTRWLREHNAGLAPEQRVGFHGLDVYSLWQSLRVVLDYLQEHQPEHVETAQSAFRCFEPYAEDPLSYARATALVPAGCEAEVVQLLQDLRVAEPDGQDGSRLARFNAEQNALALAGAEAYYRAVVRGGAGSWNVRAQHMARTLDRLMAHYGAGAKVVVWEHNTHVGDARWTDMARSDMVNLGQLVREVHSEDGVVIVGFGCHRGRVVASDRWGGATQTFGVPAARPGSTEDLLHQELGDGQSALFVFGEDLPFWAGRARHHRAVGVVYDPVGEHRGNYVPSVLGRRYDAFAWFDETRPVTPLHGEPVRAPEPETRPTGQ